MEVNEYEGEQMETDRIRKDELEDAVQRIKLGKAPGHDPCSGEMIKYLDATEMQQLLDIINQIKTKKEHQ